MCIGLFRVRVNSKQIKLLLSYLDYHLFDQLVSYHLLGRILVLKYYNTIFFVQYINVIIRIRLLLHQNKMQKSK